MVQQASGRYRHTIGAGTTGASTSGSGNIGGGSGGGGGGGGGGTIDFTAVDNAIRREHNESTNPPSSTPRSKPIFEAMNHGRRWSDDGHTEYEGWAGVVGVGGNGGGRGGKAVLDSAREMLDSMPDE